MSSNRRYKSLKNREFSFYKTKTAISAFRGGFIKNGCKFRINKFIFECFFNVISSKNVDDNNNDITSANTFLRCLENIKPIFSVKSNKVAGSILRIPYKIRFSSEYLIAARWIVQSSRNRDKYSDSIFNRVKNEVRDSFFSSGSAVRKSNELYEEAMKNRVFLKYL